MSHVSADTAKEQDHPSCDSKGVMGIIGADFFDNIHFLYIVDYYSNIPVIEWEEGLWAEHLVIYCETIFAEYKLSWKIIPASGTN